MNFSARSIQVWSLVTLISWFGLTSSIKVNVQLTEKPPTFQNNKSDEQVFLTVTALKNKSEYLLGLKANDLDLMLDKQVHPISYFAKSTEPIGVVFVIDQSGSMRIRRSEKTSKACFLPEAMNHFFLTSNELNEYSIITFNREILLRLKWTRRADDVISSFKEIGSEPPKKQSAVYDALTLAIEQAKGSSYKKRVIILFSDGEDNASHQDFAALKKSFLGSDVLVYVIDTNSLLRDLTNFPIYQEIEAQKKQLLMSIAEMCGGEILSPEDQKQLNITFEKIARELKSQYVIGFKPLASTNNKLRKIRLHLKTQGSSAELKNVSLRYREGYYAPSLPK